MGKGYFVVNGEANYSYFPSLGYVGKGNVEIENILGIRILQTRQNRAPAYPLHVFF